MDVVDSLLETVNELLHISMEGDEVAEKHLVEYCKFERSGEYHKHKVNDIAHKTVPIGIVNGQWYTLFVKDNHSKII